MAAKKIWLIIVLAGLVFFLPLAEKNSPVLLPVNQNLGQAGKLAPTNIGLPIRLKIPKINVDVALESVGLTPTGAVGTPQDFTKAAWFDLSPRPGLAGSAVITGHYGRKNNQASVFDDLNKLQPGDNLSVEYQNGLTAVFAMRERRSYNPDADAPEVFGANDNQPHLNLITCEGIWNKAAHSYPQRLVVFTDLVVK